MTTRIYIENRSEESDLNKHDVLLKTGNTEFTLKPGKGTEVFIWDGSYVTVSEVPFQPVVTVTKI